MKLVIAFTMFAGLAASANADIVTRWNFNGASATTVPGGNLSPLPSTGAGTASLVGGVTADASFGSGTSNGGSSDPAPATPTDYGWQTTTYAAQGTGSGTRGVQFNVSTLGYASVIVNYDLRHSNTSSRFEQFQYSIDGTNFVDFGAPFSGPAGDTWFNNRTVDLTGVAGVDDNANFAFRVVAVFDPNTGTGYAASATTYAGTGTWRFDMVTVNGTLPTPGAAALVGMGGLMAARRRRTR